MFTLNFKNQTVYRGHASQAFVAIGENKKPAADAVLTLSGNTSEGTYINDDRVIIAKDEKAEKLILTAKCGEDVQTSELFVRDTENKNTGFDEDNIILRFGVCSDTHVSGSWNQPRSVAKWVHCIESMQKIAGYDENGNTKLDAFTCAGDFVDAVNSFGNVNGGIDRCGYKGSQNYREVSFLRSGLEGRETNKAVEVIDGKPIMDADFGTGLAKGVEFFYCLGNHDERGRGQSAENERFTKVYTAKYFVAVMCGWVYDSKKGEGTPDFCDSSYIKYAEDLLDIHKSCDCRKDSLISEFTKNHGVDGKYAYGRFCDIYGKDTDYTEEENGLFFGNRHAVIKGIHFIAIEVSQCEESAVFLDKWCAESVKEDERKPIIVFTHEKIYHTVDSSVPKKNELDAHMSTPGHLGLLNVLAKYPQAFVWTGHTHSVLTNANAIMSDCGFTGVEASVLAYLSCEGVVGRGDVPAGNYCKKEEHDSSPVCYVEIDKNYGVRISKVDMHRSYKEESGNKDNAVYFGNPWVITDISSSGEHLIKYSVERGFDENNNAPVFPENAKVTVEKGDAGKVYVSFPAATEDGTDVVKYYKVILENKGNPDDKPWQYITNFPFLYSNEEEMLKNNPSFKVVFPAEKEPRISENLQKCVDISTPNPDAEYRAYVTAYDSWHKPSETLVSE